MLPFSIVVAFSNKQRGIGYKNEIPWKISKDMKNFKVLTSTIKNPSKDKNAIIMGRKTYYSLPTHMKPLPGRLNIVISKNQDLVKNPNIIIASSLENAFEMLKSVINIDQIFVIGGESIYKEAILLPNCEKIYATVIEEPENTLYDTFFPEIPPPFLLDFETVKTTENQYNFHFLEYHKKIIE